MSGLGLSIIFQKIFVPSSGILSRSNLSVLFCAQLIPQHLWKGIQAYMQRRMRSAWPQRTQSNSSLGLKTSKDSRKAQRAFRDKTLQRVQMSYAGLCLKVNMSFCTTVLLGVLVNRSLVC